MKFFSLCLVLALLVVPGFVGGAAGAEPSRPNILWLVSEDNDPFLGCYGDSLARTPTLDKLAREGVLYERCFTNPVCAPSRFTLISGMYPVTCGPAHHMRARGNTPSWLKGFPAYLRAAGYYTTNNDKTDYNAPIDIREAWNESSRDAHWRKRPDPKQPFFSVFNYFVTHESCLFSGKKRIDFPRTDPAKVRIPPYQPDTPAIRADWAHYYDCMKLLDEQIAARLKELADDGLADNTIVFYYSDNGGVLPRSKRFLQQSGVRVPLIVYYPPRWRHLAPAAPNSRIDAPVGFIDFAPTVLSLAGVKIPGYMQGHAFAGPAKTPAPDVPVFINRDRMDERYDMMRLVSDGRFIYIRNFRPDLPYSQRIDYMFRARGYQSWAELARQGKLTPATAMFWGEKPSEELYDMARDPDSVQNLAGDPAHRDTLEKLRAALRRRMLELKDNGLLPEGSPLEGYDASHATGAWPVERVLDLAIRASNRDPANLPEFLQALDDPSEPMRWWAAQGCTMLRDRAAPAEAILRKHLDDRSASVAIAAAEALARLGHRDAALPVLRRWDTSSRKKPPGALQAANVLDRLEVKGDSAPATKGKAGKRKGRKKLPGVP